MEQINLYGASGHALVIMDIVHANKIAIGLLYDDNPKTNDIDGIKIERPTQNNITGPLIIAIGDNNIRKRIASSVNVEFCQGIAHPSAILSPKASIGPGTVVMQGAIVQSNARIGAHCIINTGASVDHECVIDDFVHISPHATLCGNVHIGESSWIGANSIVIPGKKIGKNCIIGAGSVVNKDIPDNTLAVGNPVRFFKHNEK